VSTEGTTSGSVRTELRKAPGREPFDVEIRIHETGGLASGRVNRPLTAALVGAVMLISAVYVGLHIQSGWVPADEGTLGQSALRVLEGQLPHRDFAEIYTGGLSVIHAAAFHVFGVSLMSLRICVFLFFLAWLPAVYYIARRFVSPMAAALITLTAVSWSYPNYPAAMPSWYNLFFATFGAAALLRYLEVRTRRWLFVAGVFGGISLLIKIIGAYYIAGVLLFLAFVEQGEYDSDESQNRAISYRVFSACALLLFVATLVSVFRSRLGTGELYEFILPPTALAGAILFSDSKIHRASTGQRFRTLVRLLAPFVAGALAPIVAFLFPYALTGTLRQFFTGVASSAISRAVGLGVIRPPGIGQALCAALLMGLLAAAMYLREFQGKAVGGCVGLALAGLLYWSNPSILSGVWYSVATLTPLVVLAGGAIIVASERSGRFTKLQRQQIMLLISLAALCSLVQYPFAAPIYLSYCVPLSLVAVVAIVASARRHAGTYVLASVLGFYLLFGVVRLVPNYIYELTHKVGAMQKLELKRAGGLRIEYAQSFGQMIQFLQRRSPNGLLYAGNDCPELYFLSGLHNVTRDDGGAPAEEVLQALRSGDVRVVVINELPFFPSAQMSPAVRAEVTSRFPQSVQIGIFHVFWKP